MLALPDTAAPTAAVRPRRSDARRNYDKVIASARDAFARDGAATSLEQIARGAGVGIGTLYRHFPSRQALLEAVYIDEVEALCASAADLADRDPWDAFAGWLHRFVDYMATKQALSPALLDGVGYDAPVFRCCRAAMDEAGEPLLARAQTAGAVRPDVSLAQVIHLIGGITKMPATDRGQLDRVLEIALDGLRTRD